MPKFFEATTTVLKKPLTNREFISYQQRGKIVAYSYNEKSKRPYEGVHVLDGRKNLSLFGRKIVTGASSLIIGAITYASYVNLIK